MQPPERQKLAMPAVKNGFFERCMVVQSPPQPPLHPQPAPMSDVDIFHHLLRNRQRKNVAVNQLGATGFALIAKDSIHSQPCSQHNPSSIHMFIGQSSEYPDSPNYEVMAFLACYPKGQSSKKGCVPLPTKNRPGP